MSATLSYNNSFTLDGKSFGENASVVGEQSIVRNPSAVAAALAGTIQTRTDNDTATLSFAADPALAVGNRVDVFWNVGGVFGCRRGMLVSSISGSGPYLVTVGTGVGDVGSGDNFPVVSSAVTVGKPTAKDFAFTGNNALAILGTAAAVGVIVLTDASDVEKYAMVIGTANQVKPWYSGNGVTNPVAGQTIAKAYMSHGDSTATREMKVGVLLQ
jgi:hypothetical protein